MNLVINGAEAIGEGTPGTVMIRTGQRTVTAEMAENQFPGQPIPAGEYVFLEVSDSGCGMDEETKSKIFDPFFTTKFSGRGLGLAAAQGIVRVHKGAMRVTSRPGSGTSFDVLFPAALGRASQRPELDGAGTLQGSGNVLVIDDEPVVRLFTERALMRHGYTVVSAANGEIGIQLFAQHKDRIDLVIVDLSMPVLDGRATLEGIRRIRPDVPVILSSGYDKAETARTMGDAALAGFLHKPYGVRKLIETVAEALKGGSQALGETAGK
jgi:CheY-like chemotaxis protein